MILPLLFLEQVILALAERTRGRNVYIPFPNSLLTSVFRSSHGAKLQDCRDGDAQVPQGPSPGGVLLRVAVCNARCLRSIHRRPQRRSRAPRTSSSRASNRIIGSYEMNTCWSSRVDHRVRRGSMICRHGTVSIRVSEWRSWLLMRDAVYTLGDEALMRSFGPVCRVSSWP
jgi:hypothetical protein